MKDIKSIKDYLLDMTIAIRSGDINKIKALANETIETTGCENPNDAIFAIKLKILNALAKEEAIDN